MEATLPAVAEELLREIKKAVQETSHVPDELLLASFLQFVQIILNSDPVLQLAAPPSLASAANFVNCKHLLAVYLSQAAGVCQELSVSDQHLASILLEEEEG